MVLQQNNKRVFLSNHLKELRNRFVYFFLFFTTSFLFSYLFVDYVFNFVTDPFIDAIDFKEDKRLIYTGLTEAFVSYIKLALISAFIISSPFFIYQIWSFIAPGLLEKEKKNLKIDWLNQAQVKAEIKMGVRKILLKENFPVDEIEKFIPIIMQQTERNYRDVGFDN